MKRVNNNNTTNAGLIASYVCISGCTSLKSQSIYSTLVLQLYIQRIGPGQRGAQSSTVHVSSAI